MKKATCLIVFLAICTVLALTSCSPSAAGGGAPTHVDISKFITGGGPPSNSTGEDGDLYLDTANLVLYVKTSGAWANVGALRGPAGTGWIVGTGAPGSSLGSAGDLYFDVTSLAAYQKQGGTWTVIFSTAPESRWYVGQGDPNGVTPQFVGDLYIDLLSTMVYTWSGSSWTPRVAFQVAIPQYVFTPTYMNEMNGIAYGDGTFVAVGYGGVILYTVDGTNWDYGHSPEWTRSIRMASQAVGKAPTAQQMAAHQTAVERKHTFRGMGSAAGKGVNTSEGTDLDFIDFMGVATDGNGTFVAVGYYYTDYDIARVYVSHDGGQSWEEDSSLTGLPTSGNYPLFCVNYVNGAFVIGGEASNWESGFIVIGDPTKGWSEPFRPGSGLNTIYGAVSAGAGVILLAGGSNTLGSYRPATDTWDAIMYPTGGYVSSGGDFHGVAYGAGLYVAVGTNGGGVILTSGSTVSSSSWTSQEVPLYQFGGLYGVAYGPAGFAAVGDDGIVLTSPNGITWAKQTWGSYNNNYLRFSSVAYGQIGGQPVYAISQFVIPN